MSFEADDPATLIGLAAEGIAIGITGENIARRNADKVVALTIDGLRLRYAMALAWSDRRPTYQGNGDLSRLRRRVA